MKMGTIDDAQVRVQVVLGEATMSVARLSTIEEGRIIQLESYAGEPVQLVAGGTVIALGEVVIIDENFGIRVTELVAEGAES